MLPVLAAVGGFVNSVSGGKIWPPQSFATANINNLRIRGRYCQRTDRSGWLIIENGVPRLPKVRALPHPTVVRRHVKNILLSRNTGNRNCAPAPKWPNRTPTHFLKQRRINLSQRGG